MLLAAMETGFRLGRRVHSTVDSHGKSQITMIQASVIGLLALLLGFTFSMAMVRFDTRKQLVLDEANAIQTTFLRAELLPEIPRKEVCSLLCQYVDARLAFYNAGIDQKRLSDAKDDAERIHEALWSQAVAVGERDSRAITTGLFIQSLNETIDLHTKRLTAQQNHVPESVFLILYLVATLSMGLIGYGSGIGERRNLLVNVTAALLIASVILLITDLDRPRRGTIKVSQQTMVDLQTSFKKAPFCAGTANK